MSSSPSCAKKRTGRSYAAAAATAWHSDDADEREAVRAEVRRAARRQLRGSIVAVTILGPDNTVLEVVGRPASA
ncbi:MAG: hypothetical protein ACK6CU_09860 [Deltaproteobacteria bacterium]|jgi:hypothetical protein